MTERHFRVVQLDGKKVEFGGVSITSKASPGSAARKLLTSIAHEKGLKKNKKASMSKVKFCIQEYTQGSSKKIYGPYVGHFHKYTAAELKKAKTAGGKIKFIMKPVVKLVKGKNNMKGGLNEDSIKSGVVKPIRIKSHEYKGYYNDPEYGLPDLEIDVRDSLLGIDIFDKKSNYSLRRFNMYLYVIAFYYVFQKINFFYKPINKNDIPNNYSRELTQKDIEEGNIIYKKQKYKRNHPQNTTGNLYRTLAYVLMTKKQQEAFNNPTWKNVHGINNEFENMSSTWSNSWEIMRKDFENKYQKELVESEKKIGYILDINTGNKGNKNNYVTILEIDIKTIFKPSEFKNKYNLIQKSLFGMGNYTQKIKIPDYISSKKFREINSIYAKKFGERESNYAKKIKVIQSNISNSENEKKNKIRLLDEEKDNEIKQIKKNVKNKINELQQKNSSYYLNWKNIETKIVKLTDIYLYEDKKNSERLEDLKKIKEELEGGKVNILFQDDQDNWCIDLNKNNYFYALTSLNYYYHNPIYRPAKGLTRGNDTQKSIEHTEVLKKKDQKVKNKKI